MLNLDGILSIDKVRDIAEYTDLRFEDRMKLTTPEALALHELRFLPDEEIKRLCEIQYGCKLVEPLNSYVPEKVLSFYQETGCVPVAYHPMIRSITVVYVPELKHYEKGYPDHTVEYLPTTLYYYLEKYQNCYGLHSSLRRVPVKHLFERIVSEALDIGASDITISEVNKSVITYYDVRKKKVRSNFIFDYTFMDSLLQLITIKNPLDRSSRNPKAVDIDLNKDYRGRVMINYKFGGKYTITIRVLPNKAFTTDINDLNLTPKTVEGLITNILDSRKGLRLIVGATSSGKNTTALALLRLLVKEDRYKVVSVEIPVEQELPGIEQINCSTPEEYEANIKSLIRVNPDFVYITEIQDATGLVTVEVTNTGKCVLSTLHANSVADTISRLVDITKLDQDRVIQALHTVVYQELIRDDASDRLYPRCRYVRFTDELKYKLFGKTLGEVVKIINDNEEGDIWTFTRLTGY